MVGYQNLYETGNKGAHVFFLIFEKLIVTLLYFLNTKLCARAAVEKY